MLRHPHLKKADVARACKIKPPSVAGWFNGKTKELSAETAKIAAELFGCDAFWLATGHGTPNWKNNQKEQEEKNNKEPPKVTLEDALIALGKALEKDMPADVRDDIADTLSKLAKRKGSERDQQMVIHLLKYATEAEKGKRAA